MRLNRYWEILLRGDWKSPGMPGFSAWIVAVLVICGFVFVVSLIAQAIRWD